MGAGRRGGEEKSGRHKRRGRVRGKKGGNGKEQIELKKKKKVKISFAIIMSLQFIILFKFQDTVFIH